MRLSPQRSQRVCGKSCNRLDEELSPERARQMEEALSPITQLVNHYLGPLALAILQFLRIQPEHPDEPIPQHVVMGSVVVVIIAILAWFVLFGR